MIIDDVQYLSTIVMFHSYVSLPRAVNCGTLTGSESPNPSPKPSQLSKHQSGIQVRGDLKNYISSVAQLQP